ncbi:MAG: DUF3576 domain-containing protein [Parvularculales bacterium]
MAWFFRLSFGPSLSVAVCLVAVALLGACGGASRETTYPEYGEGQGRANVFLWDATLKTLSFAPLSSAERSSGVVITKWYRLPDNENERFKIMAYILSNQLQSSALRVTLLRQIRTAPGSGWGEAVVSQETVTELENIILRRARTLRVEAEADKDN